MCCLSSRQAGSSSSSCSSLWRHEELPVLCPSETNLPGCLLDIACRAMQGGLLPSTDWEAMHRQWLSPVARGSLLPDFALQGPVDVFLSRPTALQLFLPHSSDAGVVRRVLLREGAVVLVRGARTVRLRRGLDLPSIGLSEFAGEALLRGWTQPFMPPNQADMLFKFWLPAGLVCSKQVAG